MWPRVQYVRFIGFGVSEWYEYKMSEPDYEIMVLTVEDSLFLLGCGITPWEGFDTRGWLEEIGAIKREDTNSGN